MRKDSGREKAQKQNSDPYGRQSKAEIVMQKTIPDREGSLETLPKSVTADREPKTKHEKFTRMRRQKKRPKEEMTEK